MKHHPSKAPVPSIPWLRLALLTAIAIAVNGYHFGADDGAVYLPAIVRAIHSNLYPFGAEFFTSHASLSAFTALVGASARLFHLNVEWAVFLWHLATIYLFQIAAWKLACVCFGSQRARWSAVSLLALALSVPVAGTALVLMDPYLTARSASTPMSMLAIAASLAGSRREAALWLALTALVHPQMALFAAACLAILGLPSRWTAPLFEMRIEAKATAAALPLGFSFAPATPEYRQSLAMRDFLSVFHWRWYEWLGIAAPLAILIAFSQLQPRGSTPAFRRISRALTIFGVAATAIAILLASNARFETFLRLQPMRAFQLIYIVLFLLLGGLLGELLLNSQPWLWMVLFVAVGYSILLIQRQSYPESRHIEWPCVAPINPWVKAFLWVQGNTPPDAIFAIDPFYIERPGEDQHGFRGIAERSVLTDHFKDSGVVSLFPKLAPEWSREQAAQQSWSQFKLVDFERLARIYGVSWVVWQGKAPEGLECPYTNQSVTVCRIPAAPASK